MYDGISMWYLLLIFTCQVTNDVEYLLCTYWPFEYPYLKYLCTNTFQLLIIELSVYIINLWRTYISCILVLCQICFASILSLSFAYYSFLIGSFDEQNF